MNEQNKKVPTVRFKGFTNDWEQRELGEVAKVTMGQSPSSKNYTDNPNDYVLVQGNADLKSNEISPRVWTKEVTKQVHKGEFIMTVRAPVGYLATANMDAVIGRGVAAIDGNKYLYYLLQTKLLDRTWEKLSSGSTFESISSNDIKNLEIKVTETEEEKLIAKLMDTVTYFVTLQQRKLDLLKQLKKGLLQKMFADKDSKRPVLRFKGFHDDWEQRKLSELIQKGGSGGTPKSTNKAYYNGNIPFLGISDISKSNGYIDDTEKYISEKGLDNSSAWIVPKGAISLAMYASVGKLAILNTDAATSQAFYNMVFEDVSIRDYVYHRLGKANEFGEWTRLISTGTQSNLNADKVKNFRIQIPQIIDEIKNISTFFNQLDSLIALHQRKQNHLKLLKKSLLQQMFM